MDGNANFTLMRERGIRPTRQRLAIFGTLRCSSSHPTAEELHRALAAEAHPMSLATVYNTLQTLCEAGLCRKVATTDQSCRYDAGPSEHCHVEEIASGRTVDLPPDLSRRLVDAIPVELLSEVRRFVGADAATLTLPLAARQNGPVH